MRGQPNAKVRHNLLHLTLDVPDSDVLLNWAATPHKPLAGQVVFYSATQLVALETIAFTAGECVGYHEQFESGASGDGAYVCQLTITAPAFELRAGGAPAAVAAVATALSSGAKKGTGAKKIAQNASVGIGGKIGAEAAEGADAEAAIPEGIMADSRGVYGYMPKPDSEFAKFDFSNPKIVREGRNEFIT